MLNVGNARVLGLEYGSLLPLFFFRSLWPTLLFTVEQPTLGESAGKRQGGEEVGKKSTVNSCQSSVQPRIQNPKSTKRSRRSLSYILAIHHSTFIIEHFLPPLDHPHDQHFRVDHWRMIDHLDKQHPLINDPGVGARHGVPLRLLEGTGAGCHGVRVRGEQNCQPSTVDCLPVLRDLFLGTKLRSY